MGMGPRFLNTTEGAGSLSAGADYLRRRPLAGGVVGTVAVKSAATVFGFLVSLILARILGASGYGVYAYSMAWVEILAIFSLLGSERLIVREVAAGATRGSWGLVRGLLETVNQAVLAASLLIVVVAVTAARLITGGIDSPAFFPFVAAMFYLPFASLTRVRQAVLQGFKHVVLGQIAEAVVRPVMFVILVFLAVLFLGGSPGVSGVLLLNVIAVAAALFIATILLRRRTPPELITQPPERRLGTWVRAASHLIVMGGMLMLGARIGTILLGALREAEDVGVFAIALQASWFVIFGQLCVNPVISPTLSSLHAAGNQEGLQRVAVKAARFAFGVSFLFTFVLIVFGRWILSLFGVEFSAGYPSMIILSLALLLGTAVSPAVPLLMMTGHERQAAVGTALGAAANILVCALLIPKLSAVGAAWGGAAGIVFRHVYFTFAVWRKLSLDPSIWGRSGFSSFRRSSG